MKFNKKKMLIIILVNLLYIIGINIKNQVFISILLISLILYGLYLLWNSIFEIKILISFILLYPYNYLKYSILGKKMSIYTEYYNFENLYLTGLLMFLFTMILFLEIGIIKQNNELKFFKKNSLILILFNYLIIFNFILTGISGKIGTYGSVILTSKVEYLILPYIMVYLYSSKGVIKITNYIYIMFVIYILLLGSRVPAIQLFYLIILLNKDMFIKLRNNRGILLISVGIFSMKFLERVRNIDGNLFERIQLFFKENNDVIIINNESDVIYSGTALIGLIKDGILDLKESLKTGIAILGDIAGIDIYNVDMAIQSQVSFLTKIGGGGLISSQFYYLGREFLIIIIAVFLGKNIKFLFSKSCRSTWKNIYSLIIVSTVFRWYGYSILNIYKMGLYSILFYLINKVIYFTEKTLKTSKKGGIN